MKFCSVQGRKATIVAMGLLVASCGGGGGSGAPLTGGPQPVRFTVTATAGAGGSITPASTSVGDGLTTTLTVTPDAGFGIATVTGCGGSLTGDTYTTGAITADCTVTASFGALPASAAVPSLDVLPIKTFRFTWTDEVDSTFYRLLENPDGNSGFTQVGADIAQGLEEFDHIVPLFARIGASYILQSCNDFGCTDSPAVAVGGSLENGIGYVKASNTGQYLYGRSVGISGDGNTLIVGGPAENSAATGIDGDQSDVTAPFSGAAYVYVRSASNWTQQAYVKASNTGDGDGFGHAVAISEDGNTVAISAMGEDSDATGINGDQNNDLAANAAGAVYVFTRSGSTWSQEAYVKPDNTGRVDRFGRSISLSNDGNVLAVGAEAEDSNATGINNDGSNDLARDSGAAYVFTRSAGIWSQQAYIKADNAALDDEFGWSIALSGDGTTLAVGSQMESSAATGINGDGSNNAAPESGAVYVFTSSSGSWSQQAYVKASNTELGDRFGFSVALDESGDTLAVGSRNEDSAATGIDGADSDNSAPVAGAVFVFSRNGTTWSQQAYVKASNTETFDGFGHSVSLTDDGNLLVVGANRENGGAVGLNGDQSDNSVSSSGAAFTFVRDGGAWSQEVYIKASNTGNNDIFGESVSISGDGSALAVGAELEGSNATGINGDQSDNTFDSAGAAYIY